MHHVWKAYHGEQDYYSENNDDALKQTWKSYYDTTDDESYQDGCVIKKKRTSMSSIAAGSTHREHCKTSSCIEFAAGDLIRNPPVAASVQIRLGRKLRRIIKIDSVGRPRLKMASVLKLRRRLRRKTATAMPRTYVDARRVGCWAPAKVAVGSN